MRLALGAGLRHRPMPRRAHRLRVFPQCARVEVMRTRLPRCPPLRQLSFRKLHVDRSRLGIDDDAVTVPQQPDRPANGGFRGCNAMARSIKTIVSK